jgi:hypothetical protein
LSNISHFWSEESRCKRKIERISNRSGKEGTKAEAVELNPILEMTADREDPIPLVELKQHLVIFVPDPPGPRSARMVYDIYREHCGDVFKTFKSTFYGAFLKDWTPDTRLDFEQRLLPDLRSRLDWGYGFSDGKPRDSWLFMFHGFRPFQEPDKASFYRFEFDWEVHSGLVRDLADRLMRELSFIWWYGGFFLQGRPGSKHAVESLDRVFALAMRYWGCEVEDIEATAEQMKKGYKCVSWLTLIGEPLRSRFRDEINRARSVAHDSFESQSGVLLQAAVEPSLMDRNRLADIRGYGQIAQALLPLQIIEHESFGGNRWTEENTVAWLRRFTRQSAVV